MILKKETTEMDKEVLSIIKGIVGEDTEEKKALFLRVSRGIEYIEMERRIILEKSKKWKNMQLVGVFGCFIIMIIFLVLASGYLCDEDLVMSKFIFFLLLGFMVISLALHEKGKGEIYKAEHCIAVPKGGYFRKEDIDLINNELLNKSKKNICTETAHRGMVRYSVKYMEEEYDISDIVPYNSPEEVKVNFFRQIRLKMPDRIYWDAGEAQIYMIQELHCEIAQGR